MSDLNLRHLGALAMTAPMLALTLTSCGDNPEKQQARRAAFVSCNDSVDTSTQVGSKARSAGYDRCMAEFSAAADADKQTPAGWIGSHVGWLVFGAVVIATVVIARMVLSNIAARAEQERESTLAAGRRIAQDAQDADGERIPQNPEDLQRYADYRWAIPWERGTAFGNLFDRDGSYPRLEQAWTRACELARLGDWDQAGVFTPTAVIAGVDGFRDDSGDIWLGIDSTDYMIGAKELDKVSEHLLRTGRIESATPFERDAARDWFVTRLSMKPIPTTAPQREQQEAPAPPDPTVNWEW